MGRDILNRERVSVKNRVDYLGQDERDLYETMTVVRSFMAVQFCL